jgi:hypothetical protein
VIYIDTPPRFQHKVPDGVGEDGLHPRHEDLETLDHGDDLNEGELLLAGVVVAGGPLVFLRVRWTLLQPNNMQAYIY